MQYVEEKIVTVDGHTAIKRYLILEKVGQGAFSQCYKVQAQGTDQIYAMKIISKEKMKILQKEKLVEQIRIHQSLSHPHIVFLDHWFEDSSSQYIFLEYCANKVTERVMKTLDERCKKYDSLDEKVIKRYGLQIIDALKYLHSKRVLHRDLKLTNFFLNSQDEVKLGDFGFACRLQTAEQLKRDPCGTPNFASPQLIGGFGYSYPSDVWSLGVILYRMKYGVCPFQMPDLNATLFKIKSLDYTFPRWLSISDQLKDLIQKILVIDYDERLTLSQIESHVFFRTNEVQKSGSLRNLFSRLFSHEKTGKQRGMDSCESKKDIKKILKEKTEETPKSSKLITGNVLERGFRANVTMKEISPSKQDRLNATKIKTGMKPPRTPLGDKQLVGKSMQEKQRSEKKEEVFNQTAHFNNETPKQFELTFKQIEKPMQIEKTVNPDQTIFGNTELKKSQKPDNSKSLLSTNQSVSRVCQKPSDRIARLTNKFKLPSSTFSTPPSILQFHPSYLPSTLTPYPDHLLLYLTNGLRQILTPNTFYLIHQAGYYLDSNCHRVLNPPKMIDYLARQKLQQPKFKLTEQAFLAIAEKRHFVAKWRQVEDRWVFEVAEAVVMTTRKNGGWYLRGRQYDYVYNGRLEVVDDEQEIRESRMVYESYEVRGKGGNNRQRSSSKHKKLLE